MKHITTDNGLPVTTFVNLVWHSQQLVSLWFKYSTKTTDVTVFESILCILKLRFCFHLKTINGLHLAAVDWSTVGLIMEKQQEHTHTHTHFRPFPISWCDEVWPETVISSNVPISAPTYSLIPDSLAINHGGRDKRGQLDKVGGRKSSGERRGKDDKTEDVKTERGTRCVVYSASSYCEMWLSLLWNQHFKRETKGCNQLKTDCDLLLGCFYYGCRFITCHTSESWIRISISIVMNRYF